MTSALNPEFRFIETNGIRLHCAIQGPEEGPARGTILMVHGFPEFWYCWKNQIPPLSRHYRVVAPDLRGYNLSDKPEGVDQYKPRVICADLAGLITALGEKNVILVAHDWGGAVAWAFAAYYPQMVKKLVILNAPHPSTFARELQTNPKQMAASQYMNLFRSSRGEEVMSRNGYALMKKFTFDTMLEPAKFTAEDRAMYLAAWAQPGALTGGMNYYRAMPAGPADLRDGKAPPAPPAKPEIPRVMINVPTLVIWGEGDGALVTDLLTGLDEYVPDLRVHRIPRATHWVQHDAPEEVTGEIEAFVVGASAR